MVATVMVHHMVIVVVVIVRHNNMAAMMPSVTATNANSNQNTAHNHSCDDSNDCTRRELGCHLDPGCAIAWLVSDALRGVGAMPAARVFIASTTNTTFVFWLAINRPIQTLVTVVAASFTLLACA